MKSTPLFGLFAVLALAACGKGESGQTADTTTRDLQLAPMDSTAALNDQPAAGTPAPAPAPSPSAPVSRPAPKPTPRPSSPAPAPVGRALAAGTAITATTPAEIHSNKTKAGETFSLTVADDVTDGSGRVVIPAGAKLTMRIDTIAVSENKSDPDGKLEVSFTSLSIDGKRYDISARATDIPRNMVGRGGSVAAGDAAKVGAGAAIGAIAGRVVGGNTKGAVIGGVVGAAVGTQRAIETKDRDVVVPAGTAISLVLTGEFRR